MNNIGWFRRLFMSWNSIVRYVQQNSSSSENNLEDIRNIYEARIKDLKEIVEKNELDKSRLRSEIDKLKEELIEKRTIIKRNEEESKRNNDSQNHLQTQIAELRAKLEERTRENRDIKSDISKQLQTIGKIERTFFATTGNKGKGILGERQLKIILEKSGLPQDMWVENLTVNSKTVEFAISSGEPGKWIPVDSKVLEYQEDEDGNLIVDESYKKKIDTAAAAITKYLGKKNTSHYGVLVLQSDEIYMKLFEEYPEFFQEIISKHKVYINSPSSFIQSAHSISEILKIYEKVHNDEAIYDEMMGTLDTVAKFANSLHKTHKDFNTAMESHFPAIEKKHEKLTKKLNKAGKLKVINKLEVK